MKIETSPFIEAYKNVLPVGYWYDGQTRTEVLCTKDRLGVLSRPIDAPRCIAVHSAPNTLKKQAKWFESHLVKIPHREDFNGIDFSPIERILSLFIFGTEVRFWSESWPEIDGKFFPLDYFG